MSCECTALIRNDCPNSASADKFAFVHHTEYKKSLGSIDKTLTCICLCRSIDDEHDHTQRSHTVRKKRSLPAIDDSFGVQTASSIQEASVSRAITMEINRSQKRSAGLNKDSMQIDSAGEGV